MEPSVDLFFFIVENGSSSISDVAAATRAGRSFLSSKPLSPLEDAERRLFAKGHSLHEAHRQCFCCLFIGVRSLPICWAQHVTPMGIVCPFLDNDTLETERNDSAPGVLSLSKDGGSYKWRERFLSFPSLRQSLLLPKTDIGPLSKTGSPYPPGVSPFPLRRRELVFFETTMPPWHRRIFPFPSDFFFFFLNEIV